MADGPRVWRDHDGDLWISVAADEVVLVDSAMLRRIEEKIGSQALMPARAAYGLVLLTPETTREET